MEKTEKRRPIVVASNVLLSQSGEILLGLRSESLKWATPGGKVEAESLVEGGRREQREETGMDLRGQPICLGFSDDWEWLGAKGLPWYVCVFLLWKTWDGFAQLREDSHLQWRWFPLHQLPSLDMMTLGTRFLVTNLLPNYLALLASQQSAEQQTIEMEQRTIIPGPWCQDLGDLHPPVA